MLHLFLDVLTDYFYKVIEKTNLLLQLGCKSAADQDQKSFPEPVTEHFVSKALNPLTALNISYIIKIIHFEMITDNDKKKIIKLTTFRLLNSNNNLLLQCVGVV